MKNDRIKTTGLALLSLTVLSACGNATATDGAAEEATFSVGMVTDLGSVNDKAYNQSSWEGLQQLNKDYGYDVKYLEPQSDAEIEPSILQFVNSGTDLTWATGGTMADPVIKIAENNPETKLAVLDGEVSGYDNVVSVSFKEHEGSFLAGVVAGAMTETGKVGFIGGIENPIIQRFQAGFEAGVKAANPDAEVLVNFAGAFNRVDIGKSAASIMYNDGADVIFHAAGGTGNGIFNEAQERFKNGEQVWVIGVDKDQSLEFGTDITLTSMLKKVDIAIYDMSKQIAEGTVEGGEVVRLGLAEDGVGLAETSDTNVPAEVLELIEEYKEKIISGELIVPDQP